jgi:exopolysaccharide biosynthesis polyprenyl glycosylphosphotransferase
MNERFDKLAPGLANKVHFAVDLLLAAVGVELAMAPGRHSSHMTLLCCAAAFFWTVAASVTRIYSPSTPRRLADNLTLRAIGVMGTVLGLWLTAYLYPGIDAQNVLLWKFGLSFFLTGGVARMMAFRPLRRLSRPIQDVLIVGTGAMARTTYQNLSQEGPERLSRVVGFLTLKDQPAMVEGIDLPVWGASHDLLDVLQAHPVSEVYLAGRIVDYAQEMQEVVDACERVGMPFALPLHSLHFERAQLLSNSPARDGYLHYMSTAQKPFQYAIKRLMDIAASATALFMLSPLLVVVAGLIKLTSKGPVMFTQKRVGLHGVTFDLLKFRSMVVNAEQIKETLMAHNEQSGPVFKMENDPRITGIGRFIRRYSIDELPQLINILRGDMTIVGPRPAVPKEVAQYKAWQRRRLSVRPGLTCYWQVGGRNAIGFEEWMRLDLRYVDNFTLWVDFSLIAQTFPAVLAGRGAS